MDGGNKLIGNMCERGTPVDLIDLLPFIQKISKPYCAAGEILRNNKIIKWKNPNFRKMG